MDWILDILKEYVISNKIITTEEKIKTTHQYMIEQGYDSIGVVCDSLMADSKIKELLTK